MKVTQPALTSDASCVEADRIAATVKKDQQRVALLLPGLVEPATKVLSIAGKGPFGMFGADLFGDAEARAMDYPILGPPRNPTLALEPSWTAHDKSEIWTMTNLGSLCADRGARDPGGGSRQGLGLGLWRWHGPLCRPGRCRPPGPRALPRCAAARDGQRRRHATGDPKRSDVAIADHECPIVPDDNWRPPGRPTAGVQRPGGRAARWRDTLGLDVVYLAANHMSDKGVAGITLDAPAHRQVQDPADRPGPGNLDEALEPAYAEVAGLKVGFVAFNDVGGVARADADTPGVPWITEANIQEASAAPGRAAPTWSICNPQWWGGAEYHDDLWPTQSTQIGLVRQGRLRPRDRLRHPRRRPAPAPSARRRRECRPREPRQLHYFGQGWWQETQEGVILDLAFRGTTLVNVRLRPTVMIFRPPALLDPQGDGHYVLAAGLEVLRGRRQPLSALSPLHQRLSLPLCLDSLTPAPPTL